MLKIANPQVGAFYTLERAIRCADNNPGYSVYDSRGKTIYIPYNKEHIVVGSKVRIIGTTYYTGKKVSSEAKNSVHVVAQIKTDGIPRALLVYPSGIRSWMKLEDLELA